MSDITDAMTKSPLFATLLLLFALSLSGCSISTVMRVEDREVIRVEKMIDEVRDTPLIFVGERHDAPSHHELQLDILKAMKRNGKRLAIGMEMFEESSQRALDAWSAGKVPEESFRKVFEYNWRNIPWSLYRDIMIFARDNRIPILALNAPREIVRKVGQQGFSSLTSDELILLPEGITAEVSDKYISFISSSYAVHGRNAGSFRHLCEAQMLRNRVMARRITDYFVRHPQTSMVVLAGGGHAREKGGIPAELTRVLPYKVILPPVPMLTQATINTGDADYLLEEPSWADFF